MIKHFPKLKSQFQKAHKTTTRINTKNSYFIWKLGTLYLTYRKIKGKKCLKGAKERKCSTLLPTEKQRGELPLTFPQKPCKHEESGVKYLSVERKRPLA